MKGGFAFTLSEFRHSLTHWCAGTVVPAHHSGHVTRGGNWRQLPTFLDSLIFYAQGTVKKPPGAFMSLCLSLHTPCVSVLAKTSHVCLGTVALLSTAAAHCDLTEFSDTALQNYKLRYTHHK